MISGNAPFAYILEEINASLLYLEQICCVLCGAGPDRTSTNEHLIHPWVATMATTDTVNAVMRLRWIWVHGPTRPEMADLPAKVRGLLLSWLHIEMPPEILVMLMI
jgi:hypothetical protein